MVRKRVVSIASLLVVIVCMACNVIFNNQSLASANVVSSPIYAAEDTTIIYESGMIYEDGNLGYLDVGYQGTFGVPLEAQVLLKYNLPTIPAGYEVETASLYLPVTGGTFQATTNFSLKVSTSTNHSWAQDSGITSPPAPTSGSAQSRLLSNNVPQLKPTLAPFNFTSYISRQSAEPDPRATFILSGMTAQEAAEAGITHADHFIQMTENHAHDGSLGPYLSITYSEIVNIEITGVVDSGLYNTNPTPTFNIGTATLNGSPFTSGTQITAEGSYTLTVTAGSQSETIQFQIDKTPPTGTVIVNQGNQYTNSSSVLISISPDAGVTDITHLQYSVNGNPFTQIPFVPSFMLAIGSNDGDTVLKFKLVDRAGNQSTEYQRTITRDTEVPTGSIVINNGNVYTTNREITLNLSLGNGVTDVVAVQFSNNNSSWSGVEAFSSIKSYTLPTGDGNKTVYVRLIDRAGNIGSAQASITLDTTAPIVTGVTDGESYNSSRTITFNEGTATLNGQNFISGTPVDAEGSYVLVVTDAAGNSITLTFTIINYSVGYDGNGATGGEVPLDSQTYEAGSSVTVADNVGSLVKTGFTLIGWNTEADGSGKSYVENDTFHINEADVLLYAAWEINHYTLSFESNGGSLVALQNKPYKEQATEPSTPTRPGYTFGGWFKEAALTNQWNFTKDVITADKTLYAKWTINNSSNNNAGGNNPTPPQNSIPIPTPNPQPTPEEPKPEPEPPVVTFDDLSRHWAKGMIEELASQGIIAGYPDGSFHPNEHIKRHHMALIFTRAFEFNPIREAVSFSDVSPSHPYYEAIMSLQQAGIVDGANGNFNPNHSLTRAEMAKILTLAFEIKPGGTVAFQDVSTTHWSYDYIAALAELKIVLGDNGKFKPDEPVTRAQFVAMMYRALHVIQ
ncbi:S-layer homology domain-containing protein [Paenibacillus xylanexedens]|uniref:S-layer homology domain-containing protein n=1 Tax=Paenibacillus xylanexedens TaxID=528191 RepID=UPI0011A84639|nr:S-layer homology domain-containing protein [Paenibacillus xylanexedens]